MVNRLLCKKDWPVMGQLLQEGFPASGWALGDLEKFLVLETCKAWGSFDQEVLRGFIMLQLAADESEILLIVVHPAFRRQGVGRSLLGETTTCLALQGIARLFLEVSVENEAAVNFYLGEGFQSAGMRKDYYTHKHNKSAHILLKNI